jgi:Tfp pilus assembly protein PilN
MSYRIKVPAKTLQVDEAHLLSGLEHQLHRLQEYRLPLLVGFAVLLLAVAAVGGVLWMDRQASQKAHELEREARVC